jgi:hypothetical protein
VRSPLFVIFRIMLIWYRNTELRLQDLRVDLIARINAKMTTFGHPPSIPVFTSPPPSGPFPLRDIGNGRIIPDRLKKAKRTSASSSSCPPHS